MNILKAIYCNQYLDLKKQGKEYAANKNGTILVTVFILLSFFTILLLCIFFVPNFENEVAHFLKHTFKYSSGKIIGRILVLLLGIPIFLIVKYTLGTEKSFNKTISEFLSYDDVMQHKISKKGMVYSLTSVFLFITCLILLLLKLYI